jgi:hypothetical protein
VEQGFANKYPVEGYALDSKEVGSDIALKIMKI